MHLFYCLVVKLFRRFKSLICRRRVCHCLSQHQSTPPPTCSPPLPLLNPLSKYHLPKRCVRERQWPIWGDQDKREESVKSFLGPFVRYALHLTWPDRYLDRIIRGPSAVFFSTFSPSTRLSRASLSVSLLLLGHMLVIPLLQWLSTWTRLSCISSFSLHPLQPLSGFCLVPSAPTSQLDPRGIFTHPIPHFLSIFKGIPNFFSSLRLLPIHWMIGMLGSTSKFFFLVPVMLIHWPLWKMNRLYLKKKKTQCSFHVQLTNSIFAGYFYDCI